MLDRAYLARLVSGRGKCDGASDVQVFTLRVDVVPPHGDGSPHLPEVQVPLLGKREAVKV